MEIRAKAVDFGHFLVVNTGKVRYLIGARGQKCTPKLIENSWKIFVSYRPTIEAYAARALSGGYLEDGSWVVADCNGFFEMFLNGGWYNKPLTSFKYSDVNTYYVHDLAIRSGLAHGDISTLPKDCPFPIAVGYPGHVAYYHKGIVHQAAGHSIGTIPVSLIDRRYNGDWKFWYQIPWLDYEDYVFPEVERMLRLTDPYMRGDDVKAFQEAANKIINAGLTVDGIFGKNTEQAAKDLQAKLGLTVDGIVGPATWGAIEKELAPAPSPPVNNTELYALRAKVKELTAEKATLENKITQLESSVSALKSQLANAKKQLSVVQEDILAIKAGLNVLNKY